MDRRDGVLLFSPGAIYHPTPDLVQAELAKNPPLLRRRELQRWLDEHGQEHDAEAAQPPTVGILAVSSAGIQAEVRSLSPTAS
jgi:putative SOS response-associated peptidase YedK